MKSPIGQKVLFKLRAHGLSNTLYQLFFRALNSVLFFKVLTGIFVERPDPKFLNCPERLTALLLSREMIYRFAQDPANEMPESFVEEALTRGDECFAICDGNALAAYGWYAFGPTPIGWSDLFVSFSPACVYMYKGFTHERYRGQRLHAIGMTMALQHYLAQGFRTLVSYVESTNFDSLKSCYRMGYGEFGWVYVMRLFGRYLTYSSPGCRRFAFGVDRIAGGDMARLSVAKHTNGVRGS